MSKRVWGALLALAATVHINAADAQSSPVDKWSVGGGWKVHRAAIGCGAMHNDAPYFLFTQSVDGSIAIDLRVPGSSFSPGNRVSLQFWGSDTSGQAVSVGSYDGTAGDKSGGTLLTMTGDGNFASTSAYATSVVVSSAHGSLSAPVALPDLTFALRVVRRCLTELRRVDRGSGRPAATRPVLLNPRSPLVTPDDYPGAALREGAQGVTLVALTISAKGLISYCRVETSSGRIDLDEQTCQSLSRRARYTPALDDRGNPTEGETTQPIRWQLPRD